MQICIKKCTNTFPYHHFLPTLQLFSVGNNESLKCSENETIHFCIVQVVQYIRVINLFIK